jgi:hypothetical protein
VKADTRKILEGALAQEMFDPSDSRPAQDLWDTRRVKEALVDAFLIYERLGGRVGPAGMKSSWTPFAADDNDIWEQRRTGANEDGRGARVQVTIAKIERAERVIEGSEEMAGWLRGPLDSYPLLKQHLTMWVMREVHKERGRNPITVGEMCRKRGIKLSTFNRHVKDAAYLIAQRLNRAKVEVW